MAKEENTKSKPIELQTTEASPDFDEPTAADTVGPLPQKPAGSPVGSSSRLPNKLVIAVFFIVLAAIGAFLFTKNDSDSTKISPAAITQPTTALSSASGTQQQTTLNQIGNLELNTAKNYGNKYSSGLLPVGDNKYLTAVAKKGCHPPQRG